MITFKRFYFVLFFCFSSVLGLAQSTNSANKEAKELLNKAGQSFLKLDSKKSLDFAQRALILATKNNNDLLASGPKRKLSRHKGISTKGTLISIECAIPAQSESRNN